VKQKYKTKWPHALSNPHPSRSALTNDGNHGFSSRDITSTDPQVNNLDGTENVSAKINETLPPSSFSSALTDGKQIGASSRNIISAFTQAINLRRGEHVSGGCAKKIPPSLLTISMKTANDISSDTTSTHRQINNLRGGGKG
jgi:hypothetical protein